MGGGAFFGGAASALAGQTKSNGDDSDSWKRKQKMSNSKAPASSGSANDQAGQSAGTYKRGGKVRKTGRAKVHKGERVLTAKQAKRYEKRGAKR